MAHACSRKLKIGTYWYMVPDDRRARPEPRGPGPKGEILAKRWAARVNELKCSERAGLPEIGHCLWTLSELKKADLTEAKRRGIRTAFPQP